MFHGPICFTKRSSFVQESAKPWVLALDRPFMDGVATWPDGRFEYRYPGGYHMLQLCLGKLSERDITAFLQGQVHVGFYLRQAVLLILFKIENLMDWSDQTFALHLVAPEDRELLPHLPSAYQALSLVLVEGESGLVKDMRLVTYSKHASALLHRILQQQLESPFDTDRHAALVAEVYRQYPHSRLLAKASVLIEKAGGRQ
jgi:hypothetical protein